jgi:hypothetical protein
VSGFAPLPRISNFFQLVCRQDASNPSGKTKLCGIGCPIRSFLRALFGAFCENALSHAPTQALKKHHHEFAQLSLFREVSD